ncbi:MAG: 2Fe-2S iron-sulfur cluster-binding protein [Syntrophotalea sp.]|uniref:2Fe-2S iron-sulfur cluster-binding protein n=1 Tax=Syntrophotalea sp. TaxID=2812029 RepID=UPI003D096F13
MEVTQVSINVTDRAGVDHVIKAQVGVPLMQALRNEGLVDAICGGECACATCHVHIQGGGMEKVGKPSGQEVDMLETSLETQDNSRLSCQVIVSEDLDGLVLTVAQAEG